MPGNLFNGCLILISHSGAGFCCISSISVKFCSGVQLIYSSQFVLFKALVGQPLILVRANSWPHLGNTPRHPLVDALKITGSFFSSCWSRPIPSMYSGIVQSHLIGGPFLLQPQWPSPHTCADPGAKDLRRSPSNIRDSFFIFPSLFCTLPPWLLAPPMSQLSLHLLAQGFHPLH